MELKREKRGGDEIDFEEMDHKEMGSGTSLILHGGPTVGDTRRVSEGHLLAEFLLLGGLQFFKVFNCMRPTHITETNLLCSKSTGLLVNPC
jgi:hypothetical protein